MRTVSIEMSVLYMRRVLRRRRLSGEMKSRVIRDVEFDALISTGVWVCMCMFEYEKKSRERHDEASKDIRVNKIK